MTDTIAASRTEPARPPLRALASLATIFGFGAVTAAAACCVLPLALAALGVGASLAGAFAALAGIRIPLLAIAAAVLAVAWVMWWRGRRTCEAAENCRLPAPNRALPVLLIATALVAAAGIFPMLEPALMAWLS